MARCLIQAWCEDPARETLEGRYLIVANQTLGGAELEEKVQDRIDSGIDDFYVVVPMVEPEKEAASWVPSDPAFGIPDRTDRVAEAMEVAQERSQHRLTRESFDEIIVSTLPAGISRWLKLDLPSRISRTVDCPVTSVEADGGGQSSS